MLTVRSVDSMDNHNFLLSQKNHIISQHVYMTNSDLTGKITDISEAYLAFTGYKREDIVGKNHKIFRNYELDKQIIKQLWETLLQDKVWEGEIKNNKASGQEYWVLASITPLYNKDQTKVGYLSIFHDITNQKRLEEFVTKDPLTQLHNRRHFDTSFKKEMNRAKWKNENLGLLLLGVDYYSEYKDAMGRMAADKALLTISNILSNSLASTTHELFRVTESEFAIILIGYDTAYLQKIASLVLHDIEALKIENKENQSTPYFTLSIGGANLNLQEHSLYCNDIYNIADTNLTRAKKNGRNQALLDTHNLQIDELKHLDVTTKLPNRTVLLHDISLLETDAMLILLHIKQISTLKNLYGFDFTANLINQKAIQLQNIIRADEASLYSLNFQEFAILVPQSKFFNKYLLLLEHSVLINNDHHIYNLEKQFSANFTAGVAYGMHKVFNHADLVLQEAIMSKSNYKVYQNNQTAIQLQEENLKRLQVYKHALHEGNIIPYFQPIVDTKTSQIVKYEALARLELEDGEIISPYYFLDAAKEDQSFEFFTRQMMQKVFNIYGRNKVHVSINLSYENMASQTMLDYIKNRLQKYGGKGITFEIVESEDIKEYKVLENFICMVKKHGCEVSIDDFGSGYSNFTHILQLDIDYIKLDGSLIQKLNKDKNIENMIKGLITYSQNANIKTIAEFVSTQEVALKIKELGIDYSQGYFYGEPRAPEEYGLI